MTTCADVTEIPLIECEALAALYNSTHGDTWTNNSGWLATNLPSGWYGVTVEAGHVTRLDLHENRLSGSLPPELANFSSLSSSGCTPIS